MTIAFYMDVQIPRAITYGLRLRGVDVLTAQEDGYGTAPDDRLLDRATELTRVLFSQDEDFLAEAKYRQSEGIAFSGVIYVHQRRITIGRCVQDLELIAKAAEGEELANRVEYLPL
jgi:predicted nuclease of predicted toxin-antitoxin system